MTYKILKLVSDYLSGGVYGNRLELGDSGLNGPVDIRFIDEAGWIENAHSVFFGVNGRDAYHPTNTGGLISTSAAGDLVFFDPSNDVGRTLTQLYSGGGGLWEVDGAYAKLSTARPLDIGEQNIDNVGERIQFDTSQIYSKIQFHGTADALIYTHTEAPDPIVDHWNFYIDNVSRLAVGVDEIDAWEPLDMNGNNITNTLAVKGSLNSDFILYGSNWTDDGLIGFLKWDHANEILETSSIILRLDYDNTGAGVNTGIEFNRGSTAGDASIAWDESNDQFEFTAVTGSVYAPLSVERLKIWSEPLHKAGDIQINNTTGNMEFTDTITGTKTLAELAAGGGTGLWQSPSTETELIAPENLNLHGYAIMDCGDIKLSTGTAVSNAIDFSTGASNYIQRTAYGGNYATLYRADYMHTWSIGAVEHMHLDTTNLKMYCNILMNGMPIYGGTASGSDLHLRSTSDATKGSIMLDSPLDFGGAGTHEIRNDGTHLKFKDASGIGEKTLTELFGGSGGLWEIDGTETQLIATDDIDMQSSGGTGYGIVRCGDLELYDAHPTTLISPELHFRVVVDEGFSGFMIDYHSADAVLRFRNREVPANLMTLGDSGVLTLYNDLWIPAGYEANFGTPNTAYIKRSSGSPYDLTFYDSNVGAEKTLSQLVSSGLPSSPVQGDVVYYSGSAWVRLAPGTNGHFLQTQGAAANPQWAEGGDGMPINPVQGDIIYYNGSNWVRLAAGASGSYLKTLGAGNNPIWFNVTAGYVTDPLSNSLDCDGYDVNDIGDLDFRTSLSYAYINFDSNNDFLRYDCGSDIFEFKIGDNIRFSIETEEINAYYNLDMNNKDVIKCKDIKGQTTGTDGANRLNLDFRGDGNHRLYYTGVADNRMKYETSSGGHLFSVSSVDICQVHSAGINMASGKYIKSDSGDLEFRAPSGSKIKFVIG